MKGKTPWTEREPDALLPWISETQSLLWCLFPLPLIKCDVAHFFFQSFVTCGGSSSGLAAGTETRFTRLFFGGGIRRQVTNITDVFMSSTWCHRFFRRSAGHSTSSDLVQRQAQTQRRARPTLCTLCSARHPFTFSGYAIQGTLRQHAIGIRNVASRKQKKGIACWCFLKILVVIGFSARHP